MNNRRLGRKKYIFFLLVGSQDRSHLPFSTHSNKTNLAFLPPAIRIIYWGLSELSKKYMLKDGSGHIGKVTCKRILMKEKSPFKVFIIVFVLVKM